MNEQSCRGESSASQAHASYLATRSFASLDGLRALAITAVVWLHTTNDLPRWIALRRGFLGVDFFFIISGFLIVTLLLRERRRTEGVSLRDFYVRRFLRICPAYWLMLVLVACTVYLKAGASTADIKRDLPYAVFYVSNLVPMASMLSITWSLSAEEQFYLLVPSVAKYLPRMFPYVFLPIAYVLVSLPPFGVFSGIHLPEFFKQTTFGPILLGVILAYVLDHPGGWTRAAQVLRHPLSPLFALALVGLSCSYSGEDISGWPRLFIHASLLALLATCVVREKHALVPVLTWWPVRRIGIVSYGIYLYHLLVYWPASKLLGHTGVQFRYALFVVVAALSWAVAEVSYRLFERRFLMLKERFSSERKPVGVSFQPLAITGARPQQ